MDCIVLFSEGLLSFAKERETCASDRYMGDEEKKRDSKCTSVVLRLLRFPHVVRITLYTLFQYTMRANLSTSHLVACTSARRFRPS